MDEFDFPELMKRRMTLVFGENCSEKLTVTQDILARSKIYKHLMTKENENKEIVIGGKEIVFEHLDSLIQYLNLLHSKGLFQVFWNEETLAFFSNMTIENVLDVGRLSAIEKVASLMGIDIRDAINIIMYRYLDFHTPALIEHYKKLIT